MPITIKQLNNWSLINLFSRPCTTDDRCLNFLLSLIFLKKKL